MFICYNYYWSITIFAPLLWHQCNSVLLIIMFQKLEESLLNPDSSTEEKVLSVQGEDVDSFSTPVPALIRQIITRNLADGPSGTLSYLSSWIAAERMGKSCIIYPDLCCDLLLVSGAADENSVLEENQHLKDLLTQTRMDRDQLLSKQAALTSRVRTCAHILMHLFNHCIHLLWLKKVNHSKQITG